MFNITLIVFYIVLAFWILIRLFCYGQLKKLINAILIARKQYKLILEYEKENNCKLIYLIDKSSKKKRFNLESIFMRKNLSLDIDDSHIFRNIIQYAEKKDKDIALVIDSDGGSVVESDYVINLIDVFKQHQKYITALIPRKAFSAASLIALSCNDIYIGKFGAMSPTDPIAFNEDNERYSIHAMIEAHNSDDIAQPTAYEMARFYDDMKLYNESAEYTQRYLKNKITGRYKKRYLGEAIRKFSSGELSHHTPFHYKNLRDMHLEVEYMNNDQEKIANIYRNLKVLHRLSR